VRQEIENDKVETLLAYLLARETVHRSSASAMCFRKSQLAFVIDYLCVHFNLMSFRRIKYNLVAVAISSVVSICAIVL
jgi:hypothetical protein